jgi:hypothetical protein
MKFLTCKWIFDLPNLPAWFEHDKEVDISLEQIKKLYDTGYNVMLCHQKDGDILFVDNKRFGQR